MIRVCIESPFKPKAPADTPEFAAELERNIAYAWDLVRDSLRRGEAPFASQLFYPNVLAGGDDCDPIERQLGIDAGTAWAMAADKVIIGVDLGITDGMRARIAVLRDLEEPYEIVKRSLAAWAAKGLSGK